jgi:hypothetical protein
MDHWKNMKQVLKDAVNGAVFDTSVSRRDGSSLK